MLGFFLAKLNLFLHRFVVGLNLVDIPLEKEVVRDLHLWNRSRGLLRWNWKPFELLKAHLHIFLGHCLRQSHLLILEWRHLALGDAIDIAVAFLDAWKLFISHSHSLRKFLGQTLRLGGWRALIYEYSTVLHLHGAAAVLSTERCDIVRDWLIGWHEWDCHSSRMN